MSANPAKTPEPVDLSPASLTSQHAAEIAQWVQTDQQLLWLAPGTEMPLTGEKVMGWTASNGCPLVLTCRDDPIPLGYAELNPMRRQRRNLWLGHFIVRPDRRGRGVGTAFARALVVHAFEQLAAERLSLIVFPQNTAAVACYRKVGFVPVGEEYHQFGRRPTKLRFLRMEHRPGQGGSCLGVGSSCDHLG